MSPCGADRICRPSREKIAAPGRAGVARTMPTRKAALASTDCEINMAKELKMGDFKKGVLFLMWKLQVMLTLLEGQTLSKKLSKACVL